MISVLIYLYNSLLHAHMHASKQKSSNQLMALTVSNKFFNFSIVMDIESLLSYRNRFLIFYIYCTTALYHTTNHVFSYIFIRSHYCLAQKAKTTLESEYNFRICFY